METIQKPAVKFWTSKSCDFGNGKKNVKIIKELVEEPQIAKSVYVLKTDHNLSDIFGKEDKLSISFGEYLSKKLEIKDSQNLTLGRIYR